MTPRTMKTKLDVSGYRAAHERLTEQLRIMNDDISKGVFDNKENKLGHELEGAIFDKEYNPVLGGSIPLIESIQADGHKGITVEGGSWLVEFNSTPKVFRSGSLVREENDLLGKLHTTQKYARKRGWKIGLTAFVETLTKSMVHNKNMMTQKGRYADLHEAVRQYKDGEPVTIDIQSPFSNKRIRDKVPSTDYGFTTISSQQHMQIRDTKDLPKYLNASMIIAAPVLGISANSPFIFGDGPYWYESHIVLFEQGTDMRTQLHRDQGFPKRTTLGVNYYHDARDYFNAISLFFNPMLPYHPDTGPVLPEIVQKHNQELGDLRLHGTFVWWWVRPIIDYNPLHIRIENRPLPSGPTVRDVMANTAFYYGLLNNLVKTNHAVMGHILFPFNAARDNFYAAASKGPESEIFWVVDNKLVKQTVFELIENYLLAEAEEGLERLGIRSGERNKYLNVIRTRVNKRMIPADWKIQRVEELETGGESKGAAMRQMIKEYVKAGEENKPLI